MRGTKIFRSFVLIALSSGTIALVGCESAADRQAANDGYMSGGPHGAGSSSTALPDTPIGVGPASPNTNGIRGEQTVGERGATGSISSGTGSPGVAPAMQRDANGNVITPPAPVMTPPSSEGAPVSH